MRRSTLATPAPNARMVARAATSDADVVFLDLEDAVAPEGKDEARSAAARALRELDWGDKTRAVRVNGVDTPWCHRDVVAVVEGAGDRLDVLVVPKVVAERDVWFVDTLVTQLERGLGLAAGGIALELIVEEAAALASVEAVARCCRRTASLVLGTGDLSASLRLPPDELERGSDETWRFARARIVAAARAVGAAPVDGPWGALDDPEGCRRDALAARAMGMSGKWVIHPDQIPIVNAVFSPTADEVRVATEIVRALDAARATGDGAIRHGGRMIDAANARLQRELLLTADEVRRREAGRAGRRGVDRDDGARV